MPAACARSPAGHRAGGSRSSSTPRHRADGAPPPGRSQPAGLHWAHAALKEEASALKVSSLPNEDPALCWSRPSAGSTLPWGAEPHCRAPTLTGALWHARSTAPSSGCSTPELHKHCRATSTFLFPSPSNCKEVEGEKLFSFKCLFLQIRGCPDKADAQREVGGLTQLTRGCCSS